MSNQIVITSGAKVRNLNGVLTGTAGVVDSVPLGGANGVATLDSSGKVPVSQLPASVVTYLGTWNAATNTPTLTNGVGDAGDMYLCNVAGTVDFGAGPISFNVGDWVLYGSGTWQKSNGQNGTVTSVDMTVPTGLAISGNPITTSGTLALSLASGYTIPTTSFLSGLVPYTGATGNVDLGTYGIKADYSQFNLTPSSVPTTVGTLSWDSEYRTLQLIDGDGDTTLQIGQEQRALIHNGTGSTLTDGQVVYVTGSTGQLPSVALASNTLESTSSVTFGVVTETIPHGSDGFVTISGMVNGLNTLSFNEGDAIYLGATAGTFTNVKPTAPANLVLIGYVIKKAGGNGSIFVKIQNGYELEELHDVSITSVANNEGIFWDSATSLWKNKTIAGALGYTPANAATYVPYTGATSNVNLGSFGITGNDFNAQGLKTEYSTLFKHQSNYIITQAGYTAIGGSANGLYFNVNANGRIQEFSFDSTGDRVYTFPALSGTIALLEGSQTFTGDKTFDGITNFDSAVLFNALQNQFSNGLQIAKTNTILRSTGYMSISANAGTGSSIKFSDGNSTYDTLFNFDNTGNRNYTFPASSGTIALTSDLSAYVTLSTTQTISGDKTFTGELKSAMVSIANSNTLYTKTGYTTLSASSVSTTGWLGLSWGNSNAATLAFNNSSQYTYTFPASSGTVALTSNLSSYLPLSGGTLTGLLQSTNSINVSSGQYIGVAVGSSTGFAISSLGLTYYNSTFNLSVLSSTLTSNKTITFPDASGTVALTSNIPTVSGASGQVTYFNGTSSVTGSNNFFWDATNNRLGIGLTNPQRALEIYSATADSHLRLSGSAPSVSLGEAITGSIYQAKFGLATANGQYASGAVAGDFVILSQTGATIFMTNATEKMRVNTSGNVGIGTTAPIDLLHLAGGVTSTALNVPSNTTIGSIQLGYDGTYGVIRTWNSSPIRFNTAGVDRMFITSSGNVGIGTSSPLAKLVVATASNVNFEVRNGADYGLTGVGIDSRDDTRSTRNAMFVYGSPIVLGGGNVGIGTSSPATILQITSGSNTTPSVYASSTTNYSAWQLGNNAGSNVGGIGYLNSAFNGGGIYQNSGVYVYSNQAGGLTMSAEGAYNLYFATNNTERMRITSGGQVQIKQGGNTYSDGLSLTNSASATWKIVVGGDTNLYLGYGASADRGQFSSSTGVYTPLSDINKKKDFEVSTIGLDAILGLKPTLYRMTDEDNTEKHLGFIAQEVKDFIPQAYVESGVENKFIGLNYNAIVAALVKSVQELKAEIDELKNK